jgi:hypothetical protein
MMTFEANVKHGLPTSHEERLHQAVWLINNGASQDDAAAAVSIKASDLKRAWARVKSDQRADEVGILRPQWDAIALSSKGRLAAIHTDEGMKAAANLVFRANLTPDEVFTMVAQLNEVRSSARQVAMVKNFEDVYKERIQGAGAGITTGTSGAHTVWQPLFMCIRLFLKRTDSFPSRAESIHTACQNIPVPSWQMSFGRESIAPMSMAVGHS